MSSSNSKSTRPVRLVSLPRLVALLGGPSAVGLVAADFATPAASASQLATLLKWRVSAPTTTPRAVAGRTIAVLVKRTRSKLADPWQLNKLHEEYGHSVAHISTLSRDDAMELIDEEQERRGEGRFRRR